MADANTVGKIRRVFYWVCFILLLVFLIYFTTLFYRWSEGVAKTPSGLETFIFRTWDYLLVILATLFVESMVRGKKD